MKDHTDMTPWLHERKYEIDSLCYPLRLAYYYWKVTGDETIFKGSLWQEAISLPWALTLYVSLLSPASKLKVLSVLP